MSTISINWGALNGAGTAGAGVLNAFQQGQELGRSRAREDVLARYTANPTADALAPLAALDPQSFAVLSRNERERAELAREASARRLGGTYLRQQGGMPNALAGTAPGAPANGIATAPNGDIVVTAPAQAQQGPRVSIADLYEQDPDTANKLADLMGKMDENERKEFGHKMGAGAALALAAQSLPYTQRGAFIDENTPLLKQAGWKTEEIAGFDPTDDNIHGIAALGVGADKWLADQRAAEGQATTRRGQDISSATARRGQDISAATTRRGQDIGAATARAGQAVTMRGQDMVAARAAAKPAQVALAKSKITALDAIDNQLNRVETALRKAKYTGPIAGRLPSGISGADNAADAAIRQLAPLVRQLTRVPGEGAMSDYESRLAEAGQPSRSQTPEALAETLAGYRDLINASRGGYRDLLGEAPPAPTRRDGFKVVR